MYVIIATITIIILVLVFNYATLSEFSNKTWGYIMSSIPVENGYMNIMNYMFFSLDENGDFGPTPKVDPTNAVGTVNPPPANATVTVYQTSESNVLGNRFIGGMKFRVSVRHDNFSITIRDPTRADYGMAMQYSDIYGGYRFKKKFGSYFIDILDYDCPDDGTPCKKINGVSVSSTHVKNYGVLQPVTVQDYTKNLISGTIKGSTKKIYLLPTLQSYLPKPPAK